MFLFDNFVKIVMMYMLLFSTYNYLYEVIMNKKQFAYGVLIMHLMANNVLCFANGSQVMRLASKKPLKTVGLSAGVGSLAGAGTYYVINQTSVPTKSDSTEKSEQFSINTLVVGFALGTAVSACVAYMANRRK